MSLTSREDPTFSNISKSRAHLAGLRVEVQRHMQGALWGALPAGRGGCSRWALGLTPTRSHTSRAGLPFSSKRGAPACAGLSGRPAGPLVAERGCCLQSPVVSEAVRVPRTGDCGLEGDWHPSGGDGSDGLLSSRTT